MLSIVLKDLVIESSLILVRERHLALMVLEHPSGKFAVYELVIIIMVIFKCYFSREHIALS